MKAYILALVAFCLLFVAGCETTGDPNQGGLWGWSEDKAQQRIDQKEQQKAALEQESQAEQAKSSQLEQQSSSLKMDRDAMAAKVDSLDKEVTNVRKAIMSANVETEAAKQKQWELATRLKSVERELNTLQQDPDAAAKQAEIERLESELDRLLQEAEVLSTM